MKSLEEKLGYTFQDRGLLDNALTHSSCANESRGKLQSNERLEFLGDSILGMVVADHLYRNHPDLPEGELTRTRAALVCEESLVEVAQELGLGEYLRLGRGEESGGGRRRPSIQADAVEAVLAAVYLDGGIGAAQEFVERTLIPRMSLDMAREPENPKSALQEKLQEDGITPTYKLVETQGPPHDRTFVAQVFAGTQGLARGTGRTKKEAESQAAKSTLARLGEFFGLGVDEETRAEKAEAAKLAKAEKAAARAEEKARKKSERAQAKQRKQG